MKIIHLRNIPDDVYAALQSMAKSNHRSLKEQVKFILEREVNLIKRSSAASAAEWQKRLKNRQLSDTVWNIREDRDSRSRNQKISGKMGLLPPLNKSLIHL